MLLWSGDALGRAERTRERERERERERRESERTEGGWEGDFNRIDALHDGRASKRGTLEP
jgi:hypothetical protein